MFFDGSQFAANRELAAEFRNGSGRSHY